MRCGYFKIWATGKDSGKEEVFLSYRASLERYPGRTLRYACLLCAVVVVFPKSNKLKLREDNNVQNGII